MLNEIIDSIKSAKELAETNSENVSVLDIKKTVDEDKILSQLDEETKKEISLGIARSNRDLVYRNKNQMRKENIVNGIRFVRRSLPMVETIISAFLGAILAFVVFLIFQVAILMGILVYLARPAIYKIVLLILAIVSMIALVIALIVYCVKNAADNFDSWLGENDLPPVRYLK